MQRILSVPHAERDAWVDALLALPELPADSPGLPAGAVPYLPAGVAEILALVSEAPLREGDELVDLGSGLGRVAILAHLLSGARPAAWRFKGRSSSTRGAARVSWVWIPSRSNMPTPRTPSWRDRSSSSTRPSTAGC
jgi:hypothetical protein